MRAALGKAVRQAALAGLALLAAVGCDLRPQARPLAETQVPPGFTFQTTRGVEVTLSGAEALLAGGSEGHVTLARTDGRILYEGRLRSGREQRIRLSLANTERTLVATLEAANGVRLRAELPVLDGVAAHRFE